MPRSTSTRSWLAGGVVAAMLLALAATPFIHGARAQGSKPSLQITSPASGDKITSDDVQVTTKVSNFKVDCQQAGRPNQPGVGHLHAMIDGMSMAQLANFYCQETFAIPGDGLTPGKHKLIIDLADNTHADMMETAQEVEIDYQPANAKPLPAAHFTGDPGVELVSPKDGATVPAKFKVEVKPVNFTPSYDLEGKPNVAGYGHYHVFVDTPMGGKMGGMGSPEAGMMGSPEAGMMGTPMAGGMMHMSMAGMVLMPGDNAFELDLTAWGPGQHTIWIEPVQNDHTTYEHFGHVEFKVNVQG